MRNILAASLAYESRLLSTRLTVAIAPLLRLSCPSHRVYPWEAINILVRGGVACAGADRTVVGGAGNGGRGGAEGAG